MDSCAPSGNYNAAFVYTQAGLLDYLGSPQTAEGLSCRARVDKGLVSARGMDVAGLELGRKEGSLCPSSYLSHGSKSACHSLCLELCLVLSILPCPPKRRASSLRLRFDKGVEERRLGCKDGAEAPTLT